MSRSTVLPNCPDPVLCAKGERPTVRTSAAVLKPQLTFFFFPRPKLPLETGPAVLAYSRVADSGCRWELPRKPFVGCRFANVGRLSFGPDKTGGASTGQHPEPSRPRSRKRTGRCLEQRLRAPCGARPRKPRQVRPTDGLRWKGDANPENTPCRDLRHHPDCAADAASIRPRHYFALRQNTASASGSEVRERRSFCSQAAVRAVRTAASLFVRQA